MSALGQKPTYALQQAMSALHPIAIAKADIGGRREAHDKIQQMTTNMGDRRTCARGLKVRSAYDKSLQKQLRKARKGKSAEHAPRQSSPSTSVLTALLKRFTTFGSHRESSQWQWRGNAFACGDTRNINTLLASHAARMRAAETIRSRRRVRAEPRRLFCDVDGKDRRDVAA